MNYIAINIGPIIKTLGMARKPRELWAASYLFSYLMRCIYERVVKEIGENAVISPAQPKVEQINKGVGLYPDRIYIKGIIDTEAIFRDAVWRFYQQLYGSNPKTSNNPDLNYFNLMAATCEADKESEAIGKLNRQLDVMELCEYAADSDAANTIYNIISRKKNSSLFQLARDEDNFPIPELETIAKVYRDAHSVISEKSHQRYICVVQADGDNVGRTVSNPNLDNGKVMEISKALVEFGTNAVDLINIFGGLPIYAGGDDLLFIAPVIGKDGRNIFQLLEKIENDAFKKVADEVKSCGLTDEGGQLIEASLSFGMSITYYKYPLYEALASARHQLFDIAKKLKDSSGKEQKKAWAWSFRKHSGGTFDVAFSRKGNDWASLFQEIIIETPDNEIVSAVAHKMRENDELVNIVLRSQDSDRLKMLFEKVLEFQDNSYFNKIMELMPMLYRCNDAKDFASCFYAMLRTAKFIKGEEVKDD